MTSALMPSPMGTPHSTRPTAGALALIDRRHHLELPALLGDRRSARQGAQHVEEGNQVGTRHQRTIGTVRRQIKCDEAVTIQ